MFKCEQCGREFKRNVGLFVHSRFHNEEYRKHIQKTSRESKIGSKNPQWKGNQVGKIGVHDYIKYRLKRPDKCQCCGIRKAVDLANISQEYKRDFSDWEWLCRSCHMLKDGRMKNLKQYSHIKSVVVAVGCQ